MNETFDSAALLADRLGDALLAGEPLGHLRGLADADLQSLYAVAHGLYEQGRYQDAVHVFGYLALNDHMEPRFAIGLGASLQMAGRLEDALKVYTVAIVLDPADPAPTFHLSECLLSLGRVDDALESLDTVIAQCEPGVHDALLQRAQGLASLLVRHAADGTGDGHEH
ncbi:SycD/LcrH family type III secretion system chaperone [Ramlibacter sp. MAHUQ-53]|uniref:SycD/LcrH family type III secretion system chaperone n=1 Tax=unclassified Ramlibacter TaxID=2617605 RepID=UPI0036397380